MKQKLYAKSRFEGLNQTQSAIAAGYSDKTAPQAASRLEKDPEVMAHRDRLSAGQPEPLPVPAQEPKTVVSKVTIAKVEKMAKHVEPKPAPVETAHYEDSSAKSLADLDPLEFMRQIVADSYEDPKLRLEAAKALAPYLHAKKGDIGKKEQQAKTAESVATGKFAASAPPLRMIK